jgi:hypothetical protein
MNPETAIPETLVSDLQTLTNGMYLHAICHKIETEQDGMITFKNQGWLLTHHRTRTMRSRLKSVSLTARNDEAQIKYRHYSYIGSTAQEFGGNPDSALQEDILNEPLSYSHENIGRLCIRSVDRIHMSQKGGPELVRVDSLTKALTPHRAFSLVSGFAQVIASGIEEMNQTSFANQTSFTMHH